MLQHISRLSLGFIFVLVGAVVSNNATWASTIISSFAVGTVVQDSSSQNISTVFVGQNGNGLARTQLTFYDEERGIIDFDISALNTPLLSAKLLLNKNNAVIDPPLYLDVFGRPGDGSISDSDFALGTFYVGFFPYQGEINVSIDVTAFINSLIALSSPYAELQIVWPRNRSDGYYVAFSPVYLEVEQTPLPAALPLFASGLGALGVLGWRRKRKAKAAA